MSRVSVGILRHMWSAVDVFRRGVPLMQAEFELASRSETVV